MSLRPAILVIDDGELDDVMQLLTELGVEPQRQRGGATGEAGWLWPSRLLVSTARRAIGYAPQGPKAKLGCISIAIAANGSKTLQTMMRRMGFDYLVRQPVHPEALRLLLMSILYTEHERRSLPRWPLGYEVKVKTRGYRGRATLLEISREGCRLLVSRSIELRGPVAVRIPRALAGRRGFTLEGRVLRNESARSAASGVTLAGVLFDDLEPRLEARLEELLDVAGQGPPTLSGKVAATRLERPRLLSSVAFRAIPPLEDGIEQVPEAPIQTPPEAPRPSVPAAGAPAIGSEEPLDDFADELLEDFEERTEAGPAASSESDSVEGAMDPSERRRNPRADYPGEVVALDPRSEAVRHVLVGCDLSSGGMRVERHPSLGVCDPLLLVIRDPYGREPIVMEAEVGRDDRESGFGLYFVDPKPAAARRIDALIQARVTSLDVLFERLEPETDDELEDLLDELSRGPLAPELPEDCLLSLDDEEAPAAERGASERPRARLRAEREVELDLEQDVEPDVERDAEPEGAEGRLVVSPELSERELEELEERAAADLRSIENYVLFMLIRHLDGQQAPASDTGVLASPEEKRSPVDMTLKLSVDQRDRLEAEASGELRSLSNYIAKLIVAYLRQPS